MIQDARKLDFPGKFDAVCLGPYLVREVFSNTSKTFNGQTFQHVHLEVDVKSIEL